MFLCAYHQVLSRESPRYESSIYQYRCSVSCPTGPLLKFGWPILDKDFKKTIKHLKTLSRIVDNEAEATQLNAKNNEVLEALKPADTTEHTTVQLPCHFLPSRSPEQIHGREDVLQALEFHFDKQEGQLARKSLVLHGMGGVGKSKIALEYSYAARERYDIVLWVSADNAVKFQQGFLEASRQMKLSLSGTEDSYSALLAVKTWLEENVYKWLLIFDNADDPGIWADAWPRANHGSILITARDSTAGFGTDAECLHLKPFSKEARSAVLLHLLKRPSTPENQRLAAEVVEKLGGLPLAINQMARFMLQQRLDLQKFLSLYQCNAAKIDARVTKSGGYEHTLSTVFEVSLEQLPEASGSLLNLLAFFDPDRIHETVLQEGGRMLSDEDFSFLWDEMDLLAAEEAPLRSALLERSEQESYLKIHRLVQSTIRRRLTEQERSRCFDSVISLIGKAFPNTWNVVTSHQVGAWPKYERCLPHVVSLIGLSESGSVQASDTKAFAELIFRICWNLYEKEQYEQARKHMKYGLKLLNETSTPMCASAQMLQGLIELDVLSASTARDLFLSALHIREEHLESDSPMIASSLNALSIAYTELNDMEKALETGNRAIDIRLRADMDRIGNSYSNMASTLLKLGKADDAEEMLKRCPSLKEFTDDTFLQTGNPRFSGDMVLLGRIRMVQGRLNEALRLLSKAVTFRKQLLGNGLKTCDVLFHVAKVACLQRNLPLAANFLEESIMIAEDLPGSISAGYLARSSTHLAQILRDMGEVDRAERHLIRARTALTKAGKEGGIIDLDDPKSFDGLVHWMLW